MSRSLSDIISSVPVDDRWKLDREIDFEHRNNSGQVIPQHLGRIADSMVEWEGAVADNLGLTEADRSDIREKKPSLQRYFRCQMKRKSYDKAAIFPTIMHRRETLKKWKSTLGSAATYRALIEVFFKAGKVDYADAVCHLFNDPGASSKLIYIAYKFRCTFMYH